MIVLLYQASVFLLLLAGAAMMLWNVRAFRTVPLVEQSGPEGLTGPMISVLVPARNEALRIGPCAASLACQRYPNFEVLVLDDHSEDGTADVLASLGYSGEPSAKLRILKGQPLPPGWTGKAWACHQLAAAARGEWLLFTDADTEHADAMLASTMAMARKTEAALLSAWPRLVTESWSEKLVLPILHLAFVYYPHAIWEWMTASPGRLARISPRFRRAFGAANGQFIFIQKAVYERIGGHAASRGHLVEDLALGRAAAKEGLRLVNCDGSAISSVRMYTRFSEVWEGFTKNIRAAFENALGLYFLMGVVMSALFIGPFVFVWSARGPALWLVLAQIGVIYAIRIRLALRFGTSWLGCLLHPFGQLLTTAIGLNSWRCSAGKGVTWKGRRYEVVHPGA